MPKRILIRIEEDARIVIVSCSAVRLEREDVGSDDGLDVKVRRVRRVRGREAFDGHFGWISDLMNEEKNRVKVGVGGYLVVVAGVVTSGGIRRIDYQPTDCNSFGF